MLRPGRTARLVVEQFARVGRGKTPRNLALGAVSSSGPFLGSAFQFFEGWDSVATLALA